MYIDKSSLLAISNMSKRIFYDKFNLSLLQTGRNFVFFLSATSRFRFISIKFSILCTKVRDNMFKYYLKLFLREISWQLWNFSLILVQYTVCNIIDETVRKGLCHHFYYFNVGKVLNLFHISMLFYI